MMKRKNIVTNINVFETIPTNQHYVGPVCAIKQLQGKFQLTTLTYEYTPKHIHGVGTRQFVFS